MQVEKKDNMIAIASSITVHGILLLILLFSVLNMPNPPLGGGSGVVLNLGYVDEGTGEVQTMNEANDSPLNQEAKPQEEISPEPVPEESQPEPEPITEEEWLASEEESGVEAKKEEVKEKPTPVSTEKPAKVTEKKPNPAAEYKKPEDKSNVSGKVGTENTGGNNNGDKQGKVGDQGNPQGDINAKALYGNPGSGGNGPGGSGGGPQLDMAGWKMDFKIKTDDSDENGRLKFKIVVDGEGEVIKIETLEKSVSTAVENYYKRQIENGSFSKERNAKVAANSTGYLTIIIRSK